MNLQNEHSAISLLALYAITVMSVFVNPHGYDATYDVEATP